MGNFVYKANEIEVCSRVVAEICVKKRDGRGAVGANLLCEKESSWEHLQNVGGGRRAKLLSFLGVPLMFQA